MIQLLQFLLISLLTIVGIVVDRTTGLIALTPLLLSYSLVRSRGWSEYTLVVLLSGVADVLWQWPLGMMGLVSWGLYSIARRALPLGLSTRIAYIIGLVGVNIILWLL